MKTTFNGFPSLKTMLEKVAETYEVTHHDEAIAVGLVTDIHNWLCNTVGNDVAGNAEYQITYDTYEDYFGLRIHLKHTIVDRNVLLSQFKPIKFKMKGIIHHNTLYATRAWDVPLPCGTGVQQYETEGGTHLEISTTHAIL